MDSTALGPDVARRNQVWALPTLKPTLEATWAFMCGVLAAGAWPSGVEALHLLAAWLLADAALGCLWAHCVALASAIEGLPPIDPASAQALRLPYARIDSPGYRLAEKASRALRRWQATLARRGSDLLGAGVCVGLVLVLGLFVGLPVLRVAAGGLLLGLAICLASWRTADRLVRGIAAAHPFVAWLVGHIVLAPLTLSSVGLAGLFGLSVYAHARRDEPGAWGGDALIWAIWAVVVAGLLMARQPIIAAAAAMAAGAERLPLERLAAWKNGLLAKRPVWLVSILLAALASSHWR